MKIKFTSALNNVRVLAVAMAAVVLLSVNSCKKSEDNKINVSNNAKSWYLTASSKSTTVLKSDQGVIIEVKKEISWKDAKTFLTEEGTELTSVPITLTSKSAENPIGKYMLLIAKNDNQFQSHIVNFENNGNVEGALTENQAIDLYKKAFVTNNTAPLKIESSTPDNSNINNKQMSAPKNRNIDGAAGITTCTDWYLVETTYDAETGEVLDQDIQYLYTKCVTNNDGGGNGSSTAIDTINNIKNECIKSSLIKALSKDVKSKIKKLMHTTFLTDANINLIFESYAIPASSPNANADAYSRPGSAANPFNQIIVFNENLMPNKSEEYNVATVYHEVLHAYFSILLTKDTNGVLMISSQHENMVFNYIDIIKTDLMSLYPNMTENDAWGLAWGGLEKTSRYALLSQNQKDLIGKINFQYSTKPNANTTNASKGSYCGLKNLLIEE